MTDFKDHSPQAGCKSYICGVGQSGDCPFIWEADAPSPTEPQCQHEWRHIATIQAPREIFYCVHCLAFTGRAIDLKAVLDD